MKNYKQKVFLEFIHCVDKIIFTLHIYGGLLTNYNYRFSRHIFVLHNSFGSVTSA